MTAFVLVFSLVYVALIAGLLIAMPSIAPRGLPLGVAVPEAHLDDPAVATALRRYRRGEVIVTGIAVVVSIFLAFTVPIAGAIAPMLVLIVLSLVVYVVTRRGIRQAKAAGDWYADVPVRLTAEVTAPAHHRPPIVWPVLAAVLLVVAAGIGVAAYPHLPDPYPTHRALDGHVTATAPKTVLVVFLPLIIGALVSGLMALFSTIAARAALRATPGDDPTHALVLAAARRGILASLMSELSAVIAFGLSLIAVLDWLGPVTGVLARLGLIVLVVLLATTLIAAAVRVRRVTRSGAEHPRATGRAEAPDDDARWKAGVIYVDRDDPALFVPKRFGLGWTINFGHPAGKALAVLTILIVLAVVLTPMIGLLHR
ncbi:DUF5808 domain-containing protein [Pseudolysinimonas sp.]|uniref:DUF5808 domain-containing protein n=1 Tax=Pseudolysinimonas sp. TaxID=2680009 RepID=UPI003F7D9947